MTFVRRPSHGGGILSDAQPAHRWSFRSQPSNAAGSPSSIQGASATARAVPSRRREKPSGASCVGGDRPCGEDVPFPGSRLLAKLDSERGEDDDLSDVGDRLDRVRAWAVEHCPGKQRIIRLRRPRGGDQRTVPDATGVDPRAVIARRPADEAGREPVVHEAHIPPRCDLGLLEPSALAGLAPVRRQARPWRSHPRRTAATQSRRPHAGAVAARPTAAACAAARSPRGP